VRALIPQDLDILHCSVPEENLPAWNAGTTYAAKDQVIRNHYIFEALGETRGEDPWDNHGFMNAPWRSLGPTAPYQCLDDKLHTQTEAPEGQTQLTVTVPYARPSTGFGVLNMTAASSAVATLRDVDGKIMWQRERSLIEGTYGCYRYFFDPFRCVRDAVEVGLPGYSGTLTVTLYGPRPALGMIVVGEAVQLGVTRFGPSFGFKDYSVSSADEYGNLTYLERKKAKIGTFTVYIRPEELDYVYFRVMEIGKRPTLWMGDDGVGFQSMLVFGRLKEFDPTLSAYSYGEATFDLEGTV